MIRSRGHCNTMGTASTMALVAEALGTVLPGVAGTPAPGSRLLQARHATRVVPLLALPGRRGIDLTVDDFDRVGSHVPLLVDLLPAGRFLMDDFHRAGGLAAVLRGGRGLLHPTPLR